MNMSLTNNFLYYGKMIEHALATVDQNELLHAANHLIEAYRKGYEVLVCGNGGSAAIAEHFSCDHNKGIGLDTTLIPKVVCLNSNMSLISAIANDMGYERIFAEQICGHAHTLIVISSSGNSPNIIHALEAAHDKRMSTIALVGFDGGKVISEELADINIHVKSNNYGVVEDCHSIIMHVLAQHIRKEFAFDKTKIKL